MLTQLDSSAVTDDGPDDDEAHGGHFAIVTGRGLERCLAVTTRQIAEAAGIAEGTIFRVFPDKEAVVRAAVDLAFDPAPTERALAAIDREVPFEAQLAAAVDTIQRRLSRIWRLVSSVGERPIPPARPPDSPALAELFAAHRHRVRLDPGAAARQLRALTLAVSHPALIADEPLSPPEIVSLLLDGIRAAPGPDAPATSVPETAAPETDLPAPVEAAPC